MVYVSVLSSLIALILMYSGVSRSIPKVGYLKGVDIWMLLCLLLICFAMAEFVVLNAFQVYAGGPEKPVPRLKNWTVRKLFRIVDHVSCILYMVVFISCVVAARLMI